MGIVPGDDIALMLVFPELAPLCSFLLIGDGRHLPEGRQGARKTVTGPGRAGSRRPCR